MKIVCGLLQAADAQYGVDAPRVGPHQLVKFDGDKITLDIAGDEIVLENGWSITPLTDLEVSLYNYPVYKVESV